MAGRPTNITQQAVDTILAALQEGCSFRCACRIAHVNNERAEEWLQQARAGANGLRRKFLDGVEEARGATEKRLMSRMAYYSETCDGQQAGTGQKATAFLLERQFPDSWRERSSHEVTGKDGEPIAVAVTLTWGSPAAEPEEADLGDGDEAGSEA